MSGTGDRAGALLRPAGVEAMDTAEVELLRTEVDALQGALDLARYRHVAGIEPAPELVACFEARPAAARRSTVEQLRSRGEADLADRVAALRAEWASAAEEEAWRAADSTAVARAPDGPVPLATALARLPREPGRERRRLLARAAHEALAAAAPHREAAAEQRARARAEGGLLPAWERVVEADALLSDTDAAWRDVLGWLARRAGLAPRPAGDLARADLLHLLALPEWDGLFPPGMLPLFLRETLAPLRLDLSRIRVDDDERPSRWPGAHAFGARVTVRRQGGAADWEGLLDAVGRALAAALGPPAHARDPALSFTLGELLAGLLRDRGFLARRLGVDAGHLPDLSRLLALRRLSGLRLRAASLRVASEVERGTSGAAWHEAHREAMGLAALAEWPAGLAARDADAPALLAALRGAARAEQLRSALVERLDEDWWRNPRAAEALAGIVAGGAAEAEPALGLAGAALVRTLG
ncbi:MAG: hypothetical protein HZB56_16635 [Deltaproteobacteria bacterium]|nr:hypothetical protein [Deltaproteobacteria bacterium]